MVIFGGLELVAAGFVVHHYHKKHKKEKEARVPQASPPEQYSSPGQNHYRRRKKDSRHKPSSSSKPAYYPYSSHPKPGDYGPSSSQVWRPQQSYVDVSQMPMATGIPPPYQHTWPAGYRPPQQQPANTRLAPQQQHPYHGGGSYPYYSASTPNLAHGYQSNTGLTDDDDRRSMNGLEVYEPHDPQSPHVHFNLPNGPQPGEQQEAPPPPYRP